MKECKYILNNITQYVLILLNDKLGFILIIIDINNL